MRTNEIPEHVRVLLSDGAERSESWIALQLLGIVPPEVAAAHWRSARYRRRGDPPPFQTQVEQGMRWMIASALRTLAGRNIVAQVRGETGPAHRRAGRGMRVWRVIDAETLEWAKRLKEVSP